MSEKSPQNPPSSHTNYEHAPSGGTATAGPHYPHYNPEPYYPPPASDNYKVIISGEPAHGTAEPKK